MSEDIGWDRRLSVAVDGKDLIGHAGAVLLRKCADRTGLTGALSTGLAVPGKTPGWDRGVVLVRPVGQFWLATLPIPPVAGGIDRAGGGDVEDGGDGGVGRRRGG